MTKCIVLLFTCRSTRVTGKTVVINGVTIPKGAVVEIPIELTHHNPELWPKPDKFIPERYSQ